MLLNPRPGLEEAGELREGRVLFRWVCGGGRNRDLQGPAANVRSSIG